MPLKLRSIRFGELDGRNEVLGRDQQASEIFFGSFFEPPGFQMQEFERGHKFFVKGPRGVGKTAMLRFMQKHFEKQGAVTKLIVFKDDISPLLRSQLGKVANVEEIKAPEEAEENNDIVIAWQLYIFYIIFKMLRSRDESICDTEQFKTIEDHLKQIFTIPDENALSGLFKRFSGGKAGPIEIKLNESRSKLQLEASWIVEQISILFAENKCTSQSYYIIFDELNVNYSNKNMYIRDSIIVRDLIKAVTAANQRIMVGHSNIFVIAGIRSDIFYRYDFPHHETYKYMSGYTFEISWNKIGNTEHPILDLIKNRLIANEKFTQVISSTDDIWDIYFSRAIFGISSKDFIIERTWLRPRDIVILLGEASKIANLETNFSQDLFRDSEKAASSAFWRERFEELNTFFFVKEIENIREIIDGFRPFFTLKQFEDTAETLASSSQSIRQTLKTHGSREIIKALYLTGVISQGKKNHGKSDQKPNYSDFRFYFENADDVNFQNAYCIHKSLWGYLNIRSGSF
ncbi:MAG: hypothetical protein IOC90_02330 [Methylocystis sp.]|nr:hypothetical protein [Methylocystis sp.]MCA3585619.1 hypothetical protein [Methylocystis sp.]MCA3586861.1 hypothetical protein [Methylocystis sp.]MCA3590899.1 hypothetical protein [Methylocystis sp.]